MEERKKRLAELKARRANQQPAKAAAPSPFSGSLPSAAPVLPSASASVRDSGVSVFAGIQKQNEDHKHVTAAKVLTMADLQAARTGNMNGMGMRIGVTLLIAHLGSRRNR